eukprot:gene11771-24675_t
MLAQVNFGARIFRRQYLKSATGRLLAAYNFSTVAQQTIRITFVDYEGNRATVPALIGQSLLETALAHKIDIAGICGGGGSPLDIRRTEKWVETVYGEGPSCFYCHVKIPTTFSHLLPEQSEDESRGLKHTWDEEYSTTSRLACLITLERNHDGMVVFVPDAPPTDLINCQLFCPVLENTHVAEYLSVLM